MNSKDGVTTNARAAPQSRGRGLALLAGAAVMLAGAGALYQRIASRRDRAAYPPPGELVTVDGRRVHLYGQGSGGPTVVLVTGLGDNSLSWGTLPTKLATFTRVCVYDRPGYGWSEPAAAALTAEAIAANLHAALQAADEPGPYILVGHSFGGIYVRAFARQFPDEVAGLVLIDSSHESQSLRLPQEVLGSRRQTLLLLATRLLAPLGVVRLLKMQQAGVANRPLSAAILARMLALHNQTHFSRAVAQEITILPRATRSASGPDGLGDLPLVVLTRGVDFKLEDLPHVPPDVLATANASWQALQAELAALSTYGRQIIATQSGHYIHYTEPELIVDAVRSMVAAPG